MKVIYYNNNIKLIYQTDKEEGTQGGGFQERRREKGSTCSSRLCCAYSESLLHPDRLFIVSLGKTGIYCQAGGCCWGELICTCGSLSQKGTCLPTWASINMRLIDTTHRNTEPPGRSWYSESEVSFQWSAWVYVLWNHLHVEYSKYLQLPLLVETARG